MAKVIIGKVEYDLPELNFKAIKKVWPLVKDINDSQDLVQLMEVASKVLAIALERSDKPLTEEQIEEQMLGSEIPGIQASVEDLMIESKLLERKEDGTATPGEAPAAEAAPSTETGTPSLPNLLPPVAAEAIGS